MRRTSVQDRILISGRNVITLKINNAFNHLLIEHYIINCILLIGEDFG